MCGAKIPAEGPLAKIATDGASIADLRRRGFSGSLGQNKEFFPHRGMFFDLDKRRQGADSDPSTFFFDAIEAGNGFQIHNIIRSHHPFLHKLQDFTAASHHDRTLFFLLEFLQQHSRLFDASDIDIFKTFHGRSLLDQTLTAWTILSGVIGNTLNLFPVALKIALATVATAAVIGGSPTTLPPNTP